MVTLVQNSPMYSSMVYYVTELSYILGNVFTNTTKARIGVVGSEGVGATIIAG